MDLYADSDDLRPPYFVLVAEGCIVDGELDRAKNVFDLKVVSSKAWPCPSNKRRRTISTAETIAQRCFAVLALEQSLLL